MPSEWLRFETIEGTALLVNATNGMAVTPSPRRPDVCCLTLPGLSYREVKASIDDLALLLGATTVPALTS